jgi:hypothetical protein
MLNPKSRQSSRAEQRSPAMDIPASKANNRRPQRDAPPVTASSSSSSLCSPAPGPPLRLVGLPRFHPAAYNNPSSTAGASSGASSTSSSSASIASTGQTQDHHEQQQQQQQQAGQLAYYHQHLLAQIAPPPQISITASSAGSAASGGSQQRALRPESPKLVPRAGSPGPVTPLELAETEGYMSAGAGASAAGKKDALGVAASASCRASA